MNLSERITIDRAICHGKPCVHRLRYPVAWILELLVGGMQVSDILNEYSDLVSEDILACLDSKHTNIQGRFVL